MKYCIHLFLLFLLLAGCTSRDLHKTGLMADKAMVMPAHPLASAVGTRILRLGAMP